MKPLKDGGFKEERKKGLKEEKRSKTYSYISAVSYSPERNTGAIQLAVTAYKNRVWYVGPNMSILLSV